MYRKDDSWNWYSDSTNLPALKYSFSINLPAYSFSINLPAYSFNTNLPDSEFEKLLEPLIQG